MPPYSYCPYCGTPFDNSPEGDWTRFVCAQGHSVYQNSKPAVCAVITDGGSRVLLTRRSRAPYMDHWDLPGGFLEYGEHPEDGLRREIQEELGIQIEIEEFLGHLISTYGNNGPYVLNILYVARANVTTAVARDDISEFRWFDLDNLPEQFAFPVNAIALELWRKRCKRR
jgi:8-oxo-dGTP diphosphatase